MLWNEEMAGIKRNFLSQRTKKYTFQEQWESKSGSNEELKENKYKNSARETHWTYHLQTPIICQLNQVFQEAVAEKVSPLTMIWQCP